MPLPTAVANPTNTVRPIYMWAVLTRSGTSSVFEIPLKNLQEEISVGTVKRLVPVGDFIRSDRTDATTKDQAFVCTPEDIEMKHRNLAFGSTFFQGTCTLYITDPRDAANYVKLKSNDFACSVLPASGFNGERESFMDYGFRIETEEDCIFQENVDVS